MQPYGAYVKNLTPIFIPLLLLLCSGCYRTHYTPHDPPTYKLASHEKLSFRVSGINLNFDKKFDWYDINNHISTGELEAVQEITSSTFLKSPIANSASKNTATLNFIIYRIGIGEHDIFTATPSQYDVLVNVIDTSTGKILLSKRYDHSIPLGTIGMSVTPPTPRAAHAFHDAINAVNNALLRDLYTIRPEMPTDIPGRVHGTLRSVTGTVRPPSNYFMWSYGRPDKDVPLPFSVIFKNRVMSELPYLVAENLRNRNMFDSSPENAFDICIAVREIRAKQGGLLHTREDTIVADLKIYKNDELIHTISVGPDSYPEKSTFDSISPAFAEKIAAHLNESQTSPSTRQP